jgi:hypothetical protein
MMKRKKVEKDLRWRGRKDKRYGTIGDRDQVRPSEQMEGGLAKRDNGKQRTKMER